MQLPARPAVPRIYLSPPHLSGRELELLTEAVDSNWIAPLGPHVDAFEREALGDHRRSVCARALERHGGAPPGADRARHRRQETRSSAPRSPSRRARTRSATSARRRCSSTSTPTTWTIDPDAPRPDARASRPQVRAPSSQSTSTASAATTTRWRRSASATACSSSRTPPSRSAPPTAARRRAARASLAAFSFNGNKVITTSGGGMLVSRDERTDRARAQALDPGPRARAALPAHGDRLQLPAQQPARRGRPGAARGARRAGRRAAPHQRALPRAAGGSPGISFMPEAAYGASQLLADVHPRRPGRGGHRPRDDPARARGGGHRGAPALEADAPPARLRDAPMVGGDVSAAAVRARALPAERLRADRRRPASASSRSCSRPRQLDLRVAHGGDDVEPVGLALVRAVHRVPVGLLELQRDRPGAELLVVDRRAPA